MIRKVFFAGLAALLLATSANAGTIVGIAVNPGTTAGGGSTSTRSGLGTFHLFGLDQDNLGISSYNITMGPAVTASNNRSPVTSITDGNGDTFASGFNLLRTASNAPQMQASEPLPGSSPYIIQGFGQTAGDFASQASSKGVQPGAVVGPTTSAGWGSYLTSGGDAASGKKWVFLGEGTWNTSLPFTGASMFVPAAVLTAFGDPNNGSVATTSIIILIPEPATLSLLGLAMVGCFGMIRRRS
jgi:hypothetical protein